MKLSCALIVLSAIYLCGSLPVQDDEKTLVDAVADILKKGKDTKLADLIPMHLLTGQSKRQNRRQARPSGKNLRKNNNNNNNVNNFHTPANSEIDTGSSLSETYAQLQRQKHINSLQAQKIRNLHQELQIQNQRLRQTNFNQIQRPSLTKPSHEMSFVPIRQNQQAFQQQQFQQQQLQLQQLQQQFQQQQPNVPLQQLSQSSYNYPVAVPNAPKYNGKDVPNGLSEEEVGLFTTVGKWMDAGKTLITIPMGLFSMVAEVAKYFNRSEMIENIKDGIVTRIFGGDSEDPFAQ